MNTAGNRLTAWPGAPGLDAEPSTPRPSSPPHDEYAVTYHEFMRLGQAGNANIASNINNRSDFVAVKRLKSVNPRLRRAIRPFTSDCVVQILDSFFDNDDLVVIYETMDVSLRDITCLQPLKSVHIAAICKELLAGLHFMHEVLGLYHENLDCSTILLRLEDGTVKIANVGNSYVQNKQITSESRQHDVRSISFVMLELMEPLTFALNPRSTELKHPERWDVQIKEFFYAAQKGSLEELSSHNFLPKDRNTECLGEYVFCAIRVAKIDWDILSLE